MMGTTENVLGRRRVKQAFSLVEMLAVMGILVILIAVAARSGLGTNQSGARQGAIATLMQGLEEARMRAIELGRPVHFAIAGSDHPDREKRLSTYMIYRDETEDEEPDPAARGVVPVTRWEKLPRGHYFDPDVLADIAPARAVDGLPGGAAGEPHVLTFNSLGQLDWSSTERELLIVEGVLNDTLQVKEPSFRLEVARLTGRVRLLPGEAAP